MQCDYCPQKIHVNNYTAKTRHTQMTFADFKKMLSTVPKEVEIVFAGMAEPWLNKWCTDMVNYTFEQGYQVGVYTTTSGMTMKDVIGIHNLPFKFFTLHLPDADGIMRLKVDEKYLKVLEKVHELIDCQTMVIGKLHPLVEEITGPVQDGSPGLFSRAGNLKTLAINRKKGVLQCSACGPKIDHNVLLPNGDVLLCCMDYGQEHVIGNLLHMDYSDLFKSDEYLRVMEGLKDENSNILCRKCEVSENISAL
jgi:radical SAM protein with 4Fe4S-binding SPASM domain